MDNAEQVGSLRAEPLRCMCYAGAERGVAIRTKNAGAFTSLRSFHTFIVSIGTAGPVEVGVKLSCAASERKATSLHSLGHNKPSVSGSSARMPA